MKRLRLLAGSRGGNAFLNEVDKSLQDKRFRAFPVGNACVPQGERCMISQKTLCPAQGRICPLARSWFSILARLGCPISQCWWWPSTRQLTDLFVPLSVKVYRDVRECGP